MDDQPLVACGHCGSRNRRTSEQCFICARPLTGLEVEVPVVRAVVPPEPVLAPAAGGAERMERGAVADELEAEPRQWDVKPSYGNRGRRCGWHRRPRRRTGGGARR
ncbi:hypothetical protein [Nocardioides sp.]|jgi:hypothetical protein|uniref:hypothetical protein n=1 Tax=Nocardioides sp. TaxID=35761 RepID=UPI0026065783|nr:hypothetical protein [Nocardioides sp.]